jgi:hypothetical protein
MPLEGFDSFTGELPVNNSIEFYPIEILTFGILCPEILS